MECRFSRYSCFQSEFSKHETLEILAYSALFAFVKNYAEGKIGFVGPNKAFKFGGENLAKVVQYLFDKCKDCIVYDGAYPT